MKYTLKQVFEDTALQHRQVDEEMGEVVNNVDEDFNDFIVNKQQQQRKNSIKSASTLRSLRKKIHQLVDAYTAPKTFAKHEVLSKARDDLEDVIERKVKVASREIYRYGEYLERRGRRIEAVLFYQVCAGHSRRHAVPNKAVELMADCISKIFGAALDFSDDEHQHVISIMYGLLRWIRDFENADREAISLHEARGLRVIGTFQGLLGDYKDEEESVKQALYVLESTYGSVANASRFKTYSGCLFSLGTSFKNQCRYQEAVLAYGQAIEADKLASDYEHEQQRKQSIIITREIRDEMQRKWQKVKEYGSVYEEHV